MFARHRGRFTHGLRVMTRADLHQILRIEADSFRHPWSEHDFIEHLENPNSVALVFEESGLAVGYEVFVIGAPWSQLYSCVVHRAARRRRIGSILVAHLIRSIARQTRGIRAKVAERNVAAQVFFRQCGFRAVNVLPAYLLDDEDVYVMEYNLPGWTPRAFNSGVPDDDFVPLWDAKHG